MKKLSKKRSLGVFVKMNTEGCARKLLSIYINKRDGGVMVSPYLENWGETTCSRLTHSPSDGLLPVRESYVTTRPDNPPKFHYHRSGMSSVQPVKFERGDGRQTIHLPSMDALDGVQIFSIAARLPNYLTWNRKPRQGDTVFFMDEPDVRSLYMSGVIYDRDKIPTESVGTEQDGEPVVLASGNRNAFLIDLSGYGVEAILTLHFGPRTQDLPHFAADFNLVSIHQDHLYNEGAIAIHAGPGIPFLGLMSPVPALSEFHRTDDIDLMGNEYRITTRNQ